MVYIKINNDENKIYQINSYMRQIYKKTDGHISNDIMTDISSSSLNELSELSGLEVTAITIGTDAQILSDIQNIEGKVTQLSEQLVADDHLTITLRIEFDI